MILYIYNHKRRKDILELNAVNARYLSLVIIIIEIVLKLVAIYGIYVITKALRFYMKK